MKNTLQTTRGKIAMLLLAIFSFTAISSCTKKSDSSNDGAKFVGTWNGTSSCTGASSQLVLSAGSNGSTVTLSGDVGNGTCYKTITVNINASGNTLTIPSQTFTDLCANSYTISGSGSLSGSTLTFSLIASGALSATCVFTGTK